MTDRSACFNLLTSYCTNKCARRAAKERRRARKAAAYVADVHRMKIFERDRWICQLCGKKIKRNVVVPHPLAPTIDHMVPIDPRLGGTHEPANVQAAHFLCNSRKGNRGGGEQLALIG